MYKKSSIYVVLCSVAIFTFCGCAGITIEEEFQNGQAALRAADAAVGSEPMVSSEEHKKLYIEEARKHFKNVLKANRRDVYHWQAAIALAKIDVMQKNHNAAVEKLLEYRRTCKNEKFKKEIRVELFQTYRQAGDYEVSLEELQDYRTEYNPEPQISTSTQSEKGSVIPAVRNKYSLTPAELDFLSRFESELILLLEGKPLPSRKDSQVTVQSFPLPKGGELAVANLISNALKRNIDGLPVAVPKQPHDSLLAPYNGNISISIYRPKRDKIVLHGRGETLLSAAMHMLKKMYVSLPSAKGLRFRLDFETRRIKGEGFSNIQGKFDTGIDGLAVKRGTKEGFVLPGDILETDMQSVSALKDRLANEVEGDPATPLVWHRFRSEAYLVTGIGDNAGIVKLFRSHPADVDTSLEARKAAATAACDFLVRTQRTDGSWPYRYDPFSGPLGGKRHHAMHDAEVIHLLLDAYKRFENKAYLEAAERGLAHLNAKTCDRHDGGKTSSYLFDQAKIGKKEEERANLGAAAIAALAFARHTEVTGNSTCMETARRLIAFVLSMQHDDGSFDMFYSPEGKKLIQTRMLYYPGAAALALAAYGSNSHDSNATTAAVKALEYYMPEYIGTNRFDPQLVQAAYIAANSLKSEKKTRSLEKLASTMSSMYLNLIDKGETEPDLAGGIKSGRKIHPVILAAKVTQACAATALRRKKADSSGNRYADAINEIVPFLLRHQYDNVSTYYLPRPERAIGSVRNNLATNMIRSNVVAHWATALMAGIAVEGKKH
jgi:predicted negative regulator of RcsB-dependent stress response